MGTLGIDLGTSNSAAAVLIGREAHIVPPTEGSTDEGDVFPSYVAFDSQGNPSAIGLPAKERFANVGGELVVRHVKRLIGRPYDYVAKEIAAGKRFLDEFKDRIERGKHGEVLIRVGNKKYTPIDIATFLLEKIYKDAEAFAHEKFRVGIDQVVISIPAGLDDMQRQAIFKAGERVFDKDKVKVIEEPTAAAIARGMQSTKKNMNIMVLDVGAGTTDIVAGNVLRSEDGYNFSMTTRSCDDELGGLDMDWLILEYLFKKDQEKPYLFDLYPRLDKRERGRLMTQIEKAKIAASMTGSGSVCLTLRTGGTHKRLDVLLDKEKFAEILAPIVFGYRDERGSLRGIKPLLEQIILKIAGDDEKKIDRVKKEMDMVILLGEAHRMECVHEMCKEIFKNNKSLCEELDGIDPFDSFPMECVAKGAALSTLRFFPSRRLRRLWGKIIRIFLSLKDSIKRRTKWFRR